MSRIIGSSEMVIKVQEVVAIYYEKIGIYTNPDTKKKGVKYALYLDCSNQKRYTYDYYFEYDSSKKEESFDKAKASMHNIFSELVDKWSDETDHGPIDLSKYGVPQKTIFE